MNDLKFAFRQLLKHKGSSLPRQAMALGSTIHAPGVVVAFSNA